MGFASKVESTGKGLTAVLVLGMVGIVFLIIYGNLSGNLGFATGSLGANNTETVIGNITTGVVQFYGFAPVWFTILAVVLLIVILVGLLGVVLSLNKKSRSGGF